MCPIIIHQANHYVLVERASRQFSDVTEWVYHCSCQDTGIHAALAPVLNTTFDGMRHFKIIQTCTSSHLYI